VSSKARTHVCARPGCDKLARTDARYCSASCGQRSRWSGATLTPEERVIRQRRARLRFRRKMRRQGRCETCAEPSQRFTECLNCRLRRSVGRRQYMRRYRQLRQREAA
jgi:hypothetical protein